MSVTRRVIRVDDAPIRPGMGPGHQARHVLQPGHWEEYDPFLLLAEDWFPSGTFGPHPHRGFETVTVVVDGELQHSDNHGGSGVLGPGDVQWMTAGRGIIHVEEPFKDRVHTLQLWLNLPASHKMAEPRYQDLRAADAPMREAAGATLRVFSGASAGLVSKTLNHVPVTMVELRVDSSASASPDLPANYTAFIYVVTGSGRFGAEATPARAGQAVWFSRADQDGSSEITVHAEDALHAILWAGPPLHEPVAAGGPFIMNTQEEVAQAYADYRAGRF